MALRKLLFRIGLEANQWPSPFRHLLLSFKEEREFSSEKGMAMLMDHFHFPVPIPAVPVNLSGSRMA